MAANLDRTSPIPLYRQIKEVILEWMRCGELMPGARLPPERELVRRFGVSRLTVRQAISELASEGVVYRIQGSGTYVAGKRPVVLRALVSEREWVTALQDAEWYYNESHPHSPLRLEIRVVGRPRLRDEIVLAVASGEAPDIVLIDCAWMAELASLKFFLPIDELDPHWTSEYLADLFPVIRLGNRHGDGHLYGVQTEVSATVLWYRRDWLIQEGMAVPRTWDELVSVAKRFKPRQGTRGYPLAFCGGLRGGETTTYQLLPLFWSTGEELISAGRPALDSRAADTLRFLKDLVHVHRLAPAKVVAFSWDEPRRLFAQGQVAFAFGGTYDKRPIQSTARWSEQEFRKRVGMTFVPVDPAGRITTSVAGGMVFSVLRQTKYPEVAAELLKLLASPQLMSRFCQRTGRVPSRISVASSLEADRHWFQRKTVEILAHARPRPYSPYYSKISTQFRLMVENVLTQRMSPEEAVNRARNGIEAILIK